MSTTSQPREIAEQWFVDRCHEAGIKATHQRREIYGELAQTHDHPDAETIFSNVKQRIPAISFDTVYRNLRVMEEHGIIQKVSATGYRTRFDANLTPHHHYICTKCGLVRDFYDDHLDDFTPPADVLSMGRVCSCHMELRGVCKTCAACS